MKAPGTILVIDDDHSIRVALRESLEKAGYFVVSAANDASALELLERMTAPSIILLDINMPVLDSDQFLKIIRSDPRFAAVPVMQLFEAETLIRKDACCAIRKPFDMASVLALLETC